MSTPASDTPELNPIPPEIAVCPECGGPLHWQRDNEEISIDCTDEDWEKDDGVRCGFQSEWQPVLDKVTLWLSKLPSLGASERPAP